MIYYLLVISILSLLLVCFFYLRGMKVKKEIDYFIVFFPTILAAGIIVYEFSLAEPIDARYVDKRVRELRYYSSWKEAPSTHFGANPLEYLNYLPTSSAVQ